MILGLSGYAGAGKDTVGDILVDRFGFRRIAFADPLREMALALDPIVATVGDKQTRYSEVLDTYGYTSAKQRFPEVRMFLQRLGTEAGRQVLGEDVWVDACMRRIDACRSVNWVVTDVRFPNEASAIGARDEGYVVRVHRPSARPANTHASETAIDGWGFDDFVENNRSIDDLYDEVDKLLDRLSLYA